MNEELKEEKDLIIMKYKKIFLILVGLIPLIYIISMFILAIIDDTGCHGLFGGLGGSCNSSYYFIIGVFSIPLTIFSLISWLIKNTCLSLIISTIYFLYNLQLFFQTNVKIFSILVNVSMIVSLIVFILSILVIIIQRLIKKDSKKTN